MLVAYLDDHTLGLLDVSRTEPCAPNAHTGNRIDRSNARHTDTRPATDAATATERRPR